MKTHLLPALKLTALCFVLFVVVYPLSILGIAQLMPNQGNIAFVESQGKMVGVAHVGQRFDQDRYFNGRPSAVDYNASASGGSNKGTSNPVYLAQVQARIDTFLVHNPAVQRHEIPAELVTASGSGLDPDLSVKAALVQVKRIAHARKIPVALVETLVQQHIQEPLWGLLGPRHINVLALNIALDQLSTKTLRK